MMRRAIHCALGVAIVAACVAFGLVHAAENGTKPAPEDIQPVRMIADPYPAFNGIAVDPANGLVAMSDPNRKSLLTYDRLHGASQGAASVPVHQVIGPDTFLGMIAGSRSRSAAPRSRTQRIMTSRTPW